MDPKPGPTTSEFWLAVAAQGVAWWQVIDPSFTITPKEHAWLGLGAMALSLVVTTYYAASRKAVKVAVTQAKAVVAAPVPGRTVASTAIKTYTDFPPPSPVGSATATKKTPVKRPVRSRG